jgi:hypothetical protein
MELYISRRQKKECPKISDIEDEKGLINKRYLNANVLDYLLENPEIIPENMFSFVVYIGQGKNGLRPDTN